MDRLKRRERGFTLVEVMVALGILAAGLLTVVAAQVFAMRGGSSGRHTSDAAAIANSQVENFQRMDFDDAGLAATAGAWAPAAGVQQQTLVQTTPVDAVEMTYTIRCRIADGAPVAGEVTTKWVDVRVDWDEPNRPGRSLTLSTMIHDDPPTGG